MPTFETLFKAWSSQITDHVKEIKEDLKVAESNIIDKSIACEEKITAIEKRVSSVERQLFEIKTLNKTRIAVISAVIIIITGAVALSLNLFKVKEAVQNDIVKDKTEITNTTK